MYYILTSSPTYSMDPGGPKLPWIQGIYGESMNAFWQVFVKIWTSRKP